MGDGFQFIDIIFFAMIAAFLVLRLRGVLGRRDGHEGNYRDSFKDHPNEKSENNVVQLPDASDPLFEDALEDFDESEADASDDPLSRGLAQIRETDPDFDPDEFLSGARIAFELILGAYASGDTSTLKPLLSAEVFANFSQVIRDREQAGETLEDTLVGIKSADIMEAFVEDKAANVTAKFVSEQINVTRDENGDVIDGNPTTVINVTDFWTFARDIKSRDPNWALVATSSLD
mgnify:CR=1 FL=1